MGVNADEAFCVSNREGQDSIAFVRVPVLVQAQPSGFPGVLMPWWAFLQLDWTRLYGDRLERASARRPWEERAATLFWRGSDTGCLLPDSCADLGACGCA